MLDFQRSRAVCVYLTFTALSVASAASAFTVTSMSDAGAGSLRAAIVAANAGGVPATIDFNIGFCPAVCTIQLASALPAITVPLTMDGYTQPGSRPNSLAVGSDAVLRIVLDVNGLPGGGLTFSPTATDSIVRGLSFQNFGDGVAGTAILVLADRVAVEGNFIGIDATGTTTASNGAAYGVQIAGPGGVRIGGTAPAQRNVIAAYNGAGIYISAAGAGTVIQGNYLGMNAAGMSSLDPEGAYINGYGIWIQGGGSPIGTVTIGGTAAGSGNLIAGNRNGIRAVAPDLPPATNIGALTIQGNDFGINATETGGSINAEGIYLYTAAGSTLGPVLIGGTAAAAANVFSGGGIHAIGTSNLTIQGNGIGVNRAGTRDFGVEWGVNLEGDGVFTGSAQIGGSAPGAGNVFGGGHSGGIRIALTTATIEGNFIGVARDMKTRLNNGTGIVVDSADATIGGTSPAQRNVIGLNFQRGVFVDISMPAIRNSAKATILGNAIFRNGHAFLGIGLGGDGLTPLPNDPGDADSGANGLQNFPILASATVAAGTAVVGGTLDSMPNQTYRIEFFANTACDDSGYGEGQIFLGGGDYLTDGSGHVSFDAVTFPIPPGYLFITATATDPDGNTSEFSRCFAAIGPSASFYTLAPCRIIDTRSAAGPWGGPSLNNGSLEGRLFVIAGQCGVPLGAVAVEVNVAVTRPSDIGDLRIYPVGSPLPLFSTINWKKGSTKSNNSVVSLGPDGDVFVQVNQQNGGTVDLILDTTGYFQ